MMPQKPLSYLCLEGWLKNLMKLRNCFNDAHFSVDNNWSISGAGMVCAPGQFLCGDHLLSRYDLTSWQILIFFKYVGWFHYVLLTGRIVYESSHVDIMTQKRNAEIKDHLKRNLFDAFSCLLHLTSNRFCVFYTIKNHRSYTWPDLLGHLFSSFPLSAQCFG